MRQILLATLLVTGCNDVPGVEQGAIVAVTGVGVVTMLSEGVLSDQTVVVEDGVVIDMGPSESVEIPAGAMEVDGRGRFLLPGLMDLHVHIESEDELALYLLNGVTTIMNMKGREWHLDLRARLRNGETVGPRLFTCGPYARGVMDPEDARSVVRENANAGYDCIKNKPPWSAEAYAALHEAALVRHIPVYGHAPRNHTFDLVLAHPGQRLAHLEEMIYTTELNRYIDRYREWKSIELPVDDPAAEVLPAVRRLAQAVADAGIWVVPTEVVFDMYSRRTTDRFDELVSRSYMRYLDPIDRRVWERADRAQGAARFNQQLKLQQLLLYELRTAGAKIALGTDAVTGAVLMVMPGWSVHQELELLVGAGFSPYEALRTATVAAAEFLELADGTGTIRSGGRADFILVEDNPLERVSHASRPIGVIVRGRWLTRNELEARLEGIREAHAPLEIALAEIDLQLEVGGPPAAVRTYVGYPNPRQRVGRYLETTLNALAYSVLRAGDTDRAIEIFELNASTFDESANTHDSLGEAYLVRGDTGRAIAEYQRALDLDPNLQSAGDVLARLAPGAR